MRTSVSALVAGRSHEHGSSRPVRHPQARAGTAANAEQGGGGLVGLGLGRRPPLAPNGSPRRAPCGALAATAGGGAVRPAAWGSRRRARRWLWCWWCCGPLACWLPLSDQRGSGSAPTPLFKGRELVGRQLGSNRAGPPLCGLVPAALLWLPSSVLSPAHGSQPQSSSGVRKAAAMGPLAAPRLPRPGRQHGSSCWW